MDLGSIQFNPNHKIEAAARSAAEGIRFMIIGFAAGAASLIASALTVAGVLPPGIAMVVSIGLWLVSLAGVYGAYLAATAFGWPGIGMALIVVGALIPLVKLILFVVLLIMSINLIQRAGFSVSFFDPLRKRATK